MDPEIARQWAQSFENKSESELAAMPVPDGLYAHFIRRWHAARRAAMDAARAAREARESGRDADVIGPREAAANMLEAAQAAPISPAEPVVEAQKLEFNSEEPAGPSHDSGVQKLEFNSEEAADPVEILRARIAAAKESLDEPAPAPPVPMPQSHPLVLPQGDAALLLEQQLATSSALISHLAGYISRDDTDPRVCMSFMDRMSAMLGKNAEVGKVVGRLRGNYSETVQTIRVVRMEGEGGGRGAQT
ncbi:MAG TPA: hypothetical protein VGH02_09320 [Rhizomicrobium sp.]|jgi:hypothetical protein